MKKVLIVLLLSITIISCGNDDGNNNNSNEENPNITSEYYFKATIDGQEVILEHEENGYYNSAGSGGWNNNNHEQMMVFMHLSDFTNGDLSDVNNAAVMIHVYKEFSVEPTNCNQVKTMFQVGTETYSQNNEPTDRITITYIDTQGKAWFTNHENSPQENSTFEFTEYTDFSGLDAQGISKAIFSCTLYDGAGNSITLTNGETRSKSVQCGG